MYTYTYMYIYILMYTHTHQPFYLKTTTDHLQMMVFSVQVIQPQISSEGPSKSLHKYSGWDPAKILREYCVTLVHLFLDPSPSTYYTVPNHMVIYGSNICVLILWV